jgi:hypothetical protein
VNHNLSVATRKARALPIGFSLMRNLGGSTQKYRSQCERREYERQTPNIIKQDRSHLYTLAQAADGHFKYW